MHASQDLDANGELMSWVLWNLHGERASKCPGALAGQAVTAGERCCATSRPPVFFVYCMHAITSLTNFRASACRLPPPSIQRQHLPCPLAESGELALASAALFRIPGDSGGKNEDVPRPGGIEPIISTGLGPDLNMTFLDSHSERLIFGLIKSGANGKIYSWSYVQYRK